MKFPSYKSYADISHPWFPKAPSHWQLSKLKYLFDVVKEPAKEHDEIVTCFRDGEVTLRKNRREDGFTNALKEIGYQHVEVNDLVIHAMDAFAGAIGVSDSSGKSSPVYSVCRPIEDRSNSRYFAKLLRHMALSGFVESLAKGIRERSTDFRWADAGNIKLPVPPTTEQQKIAQFLDYETAKIDALIDEQKRLIELLTEEVKSLALTNYSQHQTFERLENLASLQNRPVQIEPYEEYTALGLYNRGRGLFHKEPVNGQDIGDSSFCYIEKEDLILSGQFAWEGAVAMATEKEEGCVVSHRYPVLRGKDRILVTEYLYALLLTKHGDFILNECSRGAAGRNRPLNTNALMKWKIRVPSLEYQLRVRNAVIKLRDIRHEASLQKQLLFERRSALISAAVTGKIDVRDWQPPAGSDTVGSNASVQTERHYG